MTNKVISIDAMGGDYGPRVIVPAAMRVLREHRNIEIIFVGREAALQAVLKKHRNNFSDRWSIVNATEEVAMDELPSQALRNKKDSSMRVALNLVKDGKADACVSAGNTGALMATARFVLKTLPGIDRPAILSKLPTRNGRRMRILDLGANVDSKPQHLFQFAVMGSSLAQVMDGIESPTVGLLNVGEEEIKGNGQVKEVAELLAQTDTVNYIGYVEGGDVFSGDVDVIVCDGFVGNIMLKACEGLSKLISSYTKEEFKRNVLSKLAGLMSVPVMRRLRDRIDPRHHNGATLIGLSGIVIKSHGSAGVIAMESAIEEAVNEIEKDVPTLIRQRVAKALQGGHDE